MHITSFRNFKNKKIYLKMRVFSPGSDHVKTTQKQVIIVEKRSKRTTVNYIFLLYLLFFLCLIFRWVSAAKKLFFNVLYLLYKIIKVLFVVSIALFIVGPSNSSQIAFLLFAFIDILTSILLVIAFIRQNDNLMLAFLVESQWNFLILKYLKNFI